MLVVKLGLKFYVYIYFFIFFYFVVDDDCDCNDDDQTCPETWYILVSRHRSFILK